MTDRCLSSGLKGYIHRRRIGAIAVVCGLTAIALLSTAGRAAAQTFEIDMYVSVQSVPGEPSMGAYYEGGSVAVPTDAIGADGMVPFDSKFDGADGYKQALEKALGRANDKFKDAGVQFRIRSIIFVPTDYPKLRPHYNAEANEYRFALNDAGQSQLLKDFAEITKDTKDAFTMFVAPITVDEPNSRNAELGRAQDFGTVSVVDAGTALRDFDNGSIIIHELAHNLGVTEHTDDPLNEAVAEQMVTEGPRRPNPKLTPEQIATIRKEVESGRYDAMRAPESGAASKTSTAVPKGKISRTGVTKKKKAKRRSATTKTGRTRQQQPTRDSTGNLIRFGVGVGGGLLRRDGGRRGHQRNQQQQHRGRDR